MSYQLSPKLRRDAILHASTRYGGWFQSGKGKLFQFCMGLLAALMLGLISGLALPDYNTGIVVLIFGAGFWTCLLLWRWSYHAQVARIVEDNKEETMTSTADASGITLRGETGSSELSWTNVRTLVLDRSALMIRLPGQTLPVPVEALPPDLTPGQVLERIEHWREAVQ